MIWIACVSIIVVGVLVWSQLYFSHQARMLERGAYAARMKALERATEHLDWAERPYTAERVLLAVEGDIRKELES